MEIMDQEYLNHEQEIRNKMLMALTEEYANIYLWNMQEDRVEEFRNDGRVPGLARGLKQGVSYQELMEQYLENNVYEEDREMMLQEASCRKIRQALEETGSFSFKYRVMRPGMTMPQYYLMKCVRPRGDEDLTGVVMGFSNIQPVMQKEMEQREALENALALAEQASRAKSTFLTNMSHDIRTPMNAIIGYTALATSHIHNKDQVLDYLKKISVSSNHLLSLINDILDMSRIENGSVSLTEELCSLPDIMHDIKNIFQSNVHAKRMDFFIDTVDVIHENIFCDKLRLNQILLNCLGNAFKFTEPGGTVSVRVIERAGAPKGYSYFQFRVKDTGIGMSKSFAEHIFEPFSRERTSTVSGIPGTGLGMPIAKNIVNMMGGNIQVESEKGVGTEFIIDLELKISDVQPASEPVKELAGLRALVVDDDYNTCTSVSSMLRSIGMVPEWTMSGKEAVLRTQYACEEKIPFRAYIIDWLLPDLNGIEVVRRIRQYIGDEMPIIILTAYDWSDIEEEAREAGVTAFCSKPLFLSELRSILISAPQKSEEKEPVEELCQTECHILLVEDNELNAEIASTILNEYGMTVDTANNGQAAIDRLLSEPPCTYDLILMDIQMPVMDGYEATREIRSMEDSRLSSIPIIAMTANAFEEDRRKALDCGMNEHIVKPIDAKLLMRMIGKFL